MQTLIESSVIYLGTSLDELFILIPLYLEGEENLRKKEIIGGQYLGLCILILFSFIGTLGTTLIPKKYISLLGIIPIFIGIKALCLNMKSNKQKSSNNENITLDDNKNTTIQRIIKIAFISIASGADNIGIYIPLFAQQSSRQMFITIIIFFTILPIWSNLAQKLANLPILRTTIHHYKDSLIPIIFVSLGIYILLN